MDWWSSHGALRVVVMSLGDNNCMSFFLRATVRHETEFRFWLLLKKKKSVEGRVVLLAVSRKTKKLVRRRSRSTNKCPWS